MEPHVHNYYNYITFDFGHYHRMYGTTSNKKSHYLTLQKNNPQERPKEKSVLPSIPNGLWIKCQQCGETIYTKDLIANYKVCSACGHHYRMTAKERIELVMDTDSFIETNADLKTVNPLNFPGYEEKIADNIRKTDLPEAVVTGYGKIYGNEAVITAMDSNFLMGSMGSVVGEKITRAFELATDENKPIIIFTASGGARMQEGIFSLMQMAKTSAAVARHDKAGGLYITVLTDPTTGGVIASFTMLADIILAEPGALIGFSGKRVSEQTIGQKLPAGFQTAEFLIDHGFIDKIVTRNQLKLTLSHLLKFHNR